MDIIWHGSSCFTIKTKNCVAVIDPYSKELGIKPPRLKADVVFLSHHQPEQEVTSVEGYSRVIDWPGEYEVKGIAVIAKNTGYRGEGEEKKPKEELTFIIEIDGIKLCFLGDLGEGKEENFVESIGDVDILFLPIGGGNGAAAKIAHEMVEEIEPRIVIPMDYAVPELKSDLTGPEEFLKLVGASTIEKKEKFTVSSRAELPEEKTECVLLTAQFE